MQKLLPLLLLILSIAPAGFAQTPNHRLQLRENEWNSYTVPKSPFTRYVGPQKDFIVRVPADWKQEGTELTFTGPDSSSLRIVVDKISDGVPLQEYVSALLRVVKDQANATDNTFVRRTRIQDIEAREIFADLPDLEGEVTRSAIWVAVRGGMALVVAFRTPIADAAKVEPYFKGVVQSVMFVNEYENERFDSLRKSSQTTFAPAPVDEIETVAATVEQPGADRKAALAQLTKFFESNSDVALDLIQDRRAAVRAAAVEALWNSNNSKLIPFLWEAVDDPDDLVAEQASKAIAATASVLGELPEKSINGLNFRKIARIWPYFDQTKRKELLQAIFSRTAVPSPPPGKTAGNPRKFSTTVSVTELIAITDGSNLNSTEGAPYAQDPHVQLGATTLLKDVPVADFALPLQRIIASNYDPLIASGLQAALERNEKLPVAPLMKLLTSKNDRVRLLALRNLAWSAAESDAARIESAVKPSKAPVSGAEKTQQSDISKAVKLTIKQIRFRHGLSSASAGSQQKLVKEGLTDPDLADLAWQHACERELDPCRPSKALVTANFRIKPFGENLFPQNLTHFVSLRAPDAVAGKFYESLQGIQMDSPRAQANVAVVMSSLRRLAGQYLGAPPEVSVLKYSGIDTDTPISLARWNATGSGARRQAIVLRVRDEAVLERLVAGYQRNFGSFTDLTDYVAVASRALPALPAILPLSAKAIISTAPTKPKIRTLQEHSSIGRRDWNGYPLVTIQHTSVDETGNISRAVSYLVLVGGVAILSDDLATISELLSNAVDESAKLESNDQFRRALENEGDVIYFSDLTALLPADPGKKANERLSESGALRISKSAWENTFHLTFEESEWFKSLVPFHPSELTSPRELLPASTVAYYMMKLDVAAAWKRWATSIVSEKEIAELGQTWKLDFANAVAPELGPECGVALLELPDLSDQKSDTQWAAFCQTKSEKLGRLFAAGELLGTAQKDGTLEIKSATGSSYFFAVRKGFVVVTNSAKAMKAFDSSEKLASTRSYLKSVEKVPNGIVAFGGYNVDAAIASVPETATDGLRGQAASVPKLFAKAFHSQRFFATATAGSVEARSSVSMDREGRYAVAEIVPNASDVVLTYATVEPRGLAIGDQKRISRLALRVRAKVPGVIDRIREDVSHSQQSVSAVTERELILSIEPRRANGVEPLKIPFSDATLAQYLQATREIPSDDKNVIARAQEIAGKDRDAWSVARKLSAWIHNNLQWKFVASGDAAQTLATREADCSEFSQLYVAMARSLGLPARIVSGLAYTGNSFGAHAWVEVWIGRWVELDPTWGTDFVDATHIRNESGALITYAALNALELEVVDARRDVADFQSSAQALTDKLIVAIPAKDLSVLVPALDLSTLVDRMSGNSAWQSMTEAEHERMSSAHRRALLEITTGYGKSDENARKVRLLHLDEEDDSAVATCLLDPEGLLLKLKLFRRDNAWYLAEISQGDIGLDIVNETLRPALELISQQHTGGPLTTVTATPFLRVLMLLEKDPAKAIAIADTALAQDPSNQPVRFLKAIALLGIEEKEAEGRELITQLANASEPYAPAVFKLANMDAYVEDVTKRENVVELYQRYVKLEPYDCRAYSRLASQFEYLKNISAAEAAYRKAVECDPAEDHYRDLALFLTGQERWKDVDAVLIAADQNAKDIFTNVMQFLSYEDDPALIEKFAASQPQRMKRNSTAQLVLAQVLFDKGKKVQALNLAKKAAALDPKSSEAHLILSEIYRGMSRWRAALQAAETALALDEKNARGHYDRACALARLGQAQAAMTALNRALELEPYYSESLAEEPDLKSLSKVPAFKKLIPEETNQ